MRPAEKPSETTAVSLEGLRSGRPESLPASPGGSVTRDGRLLLLRSKKTDSGAPRGARQATTRRRRSQRRSRRALQFMLPIVSPWKEKWPITDCTERRSEVNAAEELRCPLSHFPCFRGIRSETN